MGNTVSKKGSKKKDKGQSGNDESDSAEEPDVAKQIKKYEEKICQLKKKKNYKEEGQTRTPERGHQKIVVALHSYRASENGELTFNKGTKFEVLDDSDQDWLRARNMASQETGYISVNFVCPATSLNAQDWYFGDIRRLEAERILTTNTDLPPGTFLIRNSETSNSKYHKYTLTVKTIVYNHPSGTNGQTYHNGVGAMVAVGNHHKVQINSNDWFFIRRVVTFRTLQDLVGYYRGPGTGLHGPKQSMLTEVCPKPMPTSYDLSHKTRSHWEIPRSSLELEVEIGGGQFGEVWKGTYNGTKVVAIKKLKEGANNLMDFRREASIMKTLRHPHIVILFAVCTSEASLLIVTEYMNKGSLKNVLETEGKMFSYSELLEICKQVASGMAYLEKENFVHRDLAARNVLLDSNKFCKVADFGLTRPVRNGVYEMRSNVPLPVRWMAPESLREKVFSSMSDVWAFGVLMMEVFTLGEDPYPEFRTNEEVEHFVNRGYRMKRPTSPVDCPDPVYKDIVLKCWLEHPEQRVSFSFLEEQLEEHVSISDIEYV